MKLRNLQFLELFCLEENCLHFIVQLNYLIENRARMRLECFCFALVNISTNDLWRVKPKKWLSSSFILELNVHLFVFVLLVFSRAQDQRRFTRFLSRDQQQAVLSTSALALVRRCFLRWNSASREFSVFPVKGRLCPQTLGVLVVESGSCTYRYRVKLSRLARIGVPNKPFENPFQRLEVIFNIQIFFLLTCLSSPGLLAWNVFRFKQHNL